MKKKKKKLPIGTLFSDLKKIMLRATDYDHWDVILKTEYKKYSPKDIFEGKKIPTREQVYWIRNTVFRMGSKKDRSKLKKILKTPLFQLTPRMYTKFHARTLEEYITLFCLERLVTEIRVSIPEDQAEEFTKYLSISSLQYKKFLKWKKKKKKKLEKSN